MNLTEDQIYTFIKAYSDAHASGHMSKWPIYDWSEQSCAYCETCPAGNHKSRTCSTLASSSAKRPTNEVFTENFKKLMTHADKYPEFLI